ncbi:MAG: hypothetical protein AB7D05_10220 [Mangrovibacterium sp.]
MDLLFYTYLTVISLTGAFSGMYLLSGIPAFSGTRTWPAVLAFTTLNMLAAVVTGYLTPAFQLPLNGNWLIAGSALLYLWCWSKQGNTIRSSGQRAGLLAGAVLFLWIGWLLPAAGSLPRERDFVLPVSAGIVIALTLFAVTRIRGNFSRAGYILSVMQCAFAAYYLLAPRWSEPFGTPGPAAGIPAGAVSSPGSGIVLATAFILIFLFGLFSKKIIKKKNL